MGICKRCHTPSKTNPNGFCAACEEYIDLDIEQGKRLLDEIHRKIEFNSGRVTLGMEDAYVPELIRVVKAFRKYYRWGYWVLPSLNQAESLVLTLDSDRKHYTRLMWSWREVIPYALATLGGITWLLVFVYIGFRVSVGV